MKRAYLAGPEVFLPDAVAVGEAKKMICAEHAIEGVYPLDEPAPAFEAGPLFERCLALIDACDLVIANLTPFRGPSMDVGTAVEMGYALGSAKPVFGYTNVPADYRDRVADDGLFVEDFGLVDNLMCDSAVQRHGGTVVRIASAADPSDPLLLLADLTGFRAAVAQAAAWSPELPNSRQ